MGCLVVVVDLWSGASGQKKDISEFSAMGGKSESALRLEEKKSMHKMFRVRR